MHDHQMIYEQPLNELIRVCLRLEHLFNKVKDNMQLSSAWSSRSALAAMLELVNLIDRPDLKTKLSKSLSQHAAMLTPLKDIPQVDTVMLTGILDELDRIIDHMYVVNGKLGQRLRDNEFLSNIRSHLNNPGGPCDFSLPAYHLWLNQSATDRTQDLQRWFSEIELLDTAVQLLLRLTRQSKPTTSRTAVQGYFQDSLSLGMQGELIRIMVPTKLQLYPEISVGRHRISIRFYHANTATRAIQTELDVDFRVAYCALDPPKKTVKIEGSVIS